MSRALDAISQNSFPGPVKDIGPILAAIMLFNYIKTHLSLMPIHFDQNILLKLYFLGFAFQEK